MSTETQQLVIAVMVAAHGIGHVLFLLPTWTGMVLQPVSQPSHSWLLTPIVGQVPSRVLAGLLALIALVGFVAGAYGLAFDHSWAQPVTLVSAGASVALVAAFWDGLSSSRIPAVLFDLVVVLAVWAAWPSPAAIGA